MGIWMSFRLLTMTTPLLGMRMMGMQTLALQLLILLHLLIELILFMQQIWTGMGTWISFLLLVMITPLRGMKMMGMPNLALQRLILLHQLMEQHLFMQQIWMGMAI